MTDTAFVENEENTLPCQPQGSSLAPRYISFILCLLAQSFMVACSVLMCTNCYCRMTEEVNIEEYNHYSCAVWTACVKLFSVATSFLLNVLLS